MSKPNRSRSRPSLAAAGPQGDIVRGRTPPACLTDPTSVTGLRALASRDPRWWQRLKPPASARPGLTTRATVADVFGSGLVDRLYARGPDDLHRLYADRGAAARLVRLVGSMPAADIDEACLRQVIDGELPGAPGESTRSRDAGLLRAAIIAFRREVGLPVELFSRASPLGGRITPPPLACRAEDVIAVLQRCDPLLRLGIGHTLGAGATPAELLVLGRRDHVTLRGEWPFVLLGARDRKRPVALPPWLVALLKDAGAAEWVRQGAGRVFPTSASRDRLSSALATATRRAGLERSAVTFTRLRATWQAVVGPEDAFRAAIRGRWALPPSFHRTAPRAWPKAARGVYGPILHAARRWKVLSEPGAGWPQRVLPTPSGRIRPDEPEQRESDRPLPGLVR